MLANLQPQRRPEAPSPEPEARGSSSTPSPSSQQQQQQAEGSGRPWWKFWEKDEGSHSAAGGAEGQQPKPEGLPGEPKPVEAIIIPPDLPLEEIAR